MGSRTVIACCAWEHVDLQGEGQGDACMQGRADHAMGDAVSFPPCAPPHASP
jgi:hypothetical protein